MTNDSTGTGMNTNETNPTQSELQRMAAINPHAKREVDAEALFAKAFESAPDAPRELEKPGSPAKPRSLARIGAWSLGATSLAAAVAVVASSGVLSPVATETPLQLAHGSVDVHSGWMPSDWPNTAGRLTSGETTSGFYPASAIGPGPFGVAQVWLPHKITYLPGRSLSTKGAKGHIYELRAFANLAGLAKKLAKVVGIQEIPAFHTKNGITDFYNAQFAADGTLRQKGYSGSKDPRKTGGKITDPHADNFWLSTDKYASVQSFRGRSEYFQYSDNAASRWLICQQSKLPYAAGCSKLVKEPLPTFNSAKNYAKSVLSTLGVASGTTLSKTPDGGYLLEAKDGAGQTGYLTSATYGPARGTTSLDRQGVTVLGHLVVGGVVTATEIHFYWYEGSSKIGEFGGTLAKAVDHGLFAMVSPREGVKRLAARTFGATPYLPASTVKSPLNEDALQNFNSWLGNQLYICQLEKAALDYPKRAKQILRLRKGAKCSLDTTEGVPHLYANVVRANPAPLSLFDSVGREWLVPGYNYADYTGYLASVHAVMPSAIAGLRKNN